MDVRVPEHRDLHASSLHEPSSEPLRRVVPGNHSVYTHTEIARSVRGPKLQGPLAEYALVESYLAQKILVT